jgi:hypothetical protein
MVATTFGDWAMVSPWKADRGKDAAIKRAPRWRTSVVALLGMVVDYIYIRFLFVHIRIACPCPSNWSRNRKSCLPGCLLKAERAAKVCIQSAPAASQSELRVGSFGLEGAMKTCPANPASVLRVGDGRGFIVERRWKLKLPIYEKPLTRRERFVVSAAHCLPGMPPAHAFSYAHERTFKVLGKLGEEPEVFGECVFYDPIMDVAVLARPDGEIAEYDADAFTSLIQSAEPFGVAEAFPESGWVLSLQGEWVATKLRRARPDSHSFAIERTGAGMSGSPVVDDAGRAIGVVVLGTYTGDFTRRKVSAAMHASEMDWGQPLLGWLLRGME